MKLRISMAAAFVLVTTTIVGACGDDTIRASTPTSTTPTPSTTAATDTTSSSTPPGRIAAGVLADTYTFHVTSMTVAGDGTGTASWRADTTSMAMAQATFHLTSVIGREADGVVDTSTDSSGWRLGESFHLTLQANDVLLVTPSGPFSPLCGSAALAEDRAGGAQDDVNCGA